MAWEIGAVLWQRRRDSGVGWTTAGLTIDPVPATHRFRGGFTVVNGAPGDPIGTGDVIVQYFNGAAWVDHGAYSAKFLDPGYSASDPFPHTVPPEFAVWDVLFSSANFNGVIPGYLRTRLELTYGFEVRFSPEILVTAYGDLLEGELAEFLQDDGAGVLATVFPYRYRGIFEAPNSPTLGVAGRRPVLLVETEFLDYVDLGADVTIENDARTWKVRELAPQARVHGMTELRLEEQ